MNIEKYKIDYSKLNVGDKLWSIQLGDCTMRGIGLNAQLGRMIVCDNAEGLEVCYTEEGFHSKKDKFPSLFTSNPFAEEEDPLRELKEGLVWGGTFGPKPEKVFTQKDIERGKNLINELTEKLHHAADSTRYAVHAELNEKSLRYNQGKTDWTFISFEALKPLVEVLEFGARKYARDNWKLPTDPKIPLQSMLRHIIELSEGQTIDSESGAPTIGHIMANAMFYAYHTIVTEKGGLK